MSRHYLGSFHIEQDMGWEPELRSGTWANTRRTILRTWTLYERVGSPCYETPRRHFPSEAKALAFLNTNPAPGSVK